MQGDSAQLKNELRRTVLGRRDALSIEQRSHAAQVIAATTLPVELPHGVIVAGYSPINSELDPFPLMDALDRQLVKKFTRLVSAVCAN